MWFPLSPETLRPASPGGPTRLGSSLEVVEALHGATGAQGGDQRAPTPWVGRTGRDQPTKGGGGPWDTLGTAGMAAQWLADPHSLPFSKAPLPPASSLGPAAVPPDRPEPRVWGWKRVRPQGAVGTLRPSAHLWNRWEH